MRSLLHRSIVQRGVLVLVLAGSLAGAAGITNTASVGAAQQRLPTCKRLHFVLDRLPVDSELFRWASMKDCTGSW